MGGDAFTPLVPFRFRLLQRRRQLRVRLRLELQHLFDRLDVGVLILDLRGEERLLFLAGLRFGLEQRLERQRRALLVADAGDLEIIHRALRPRIDLHRRHAAHRGVVPPAGGAEELRQKLLLGRTRATDHHHGCGNEQKSSSGLSHSSSSGGLEDPPLRTRSLTALRAAFLTACRPRRRPPRAPPTRSCRRLRDPSASRLAWRGRWSGFRRPRSAGFCPAP